MCSVVRKDIFTNIGMLDESKILIGYEDWEFWIRAGIENRKFYFIDEELYEYRLRDNSLITKVSMAEKFEKMIQYVYGKNYSYFQNYIIKYNNLEIANAKEKATPFKSFLRNLYRKFINPVK